MKNNFIYLCICQILNDILFHFSGKILLKINYNLTVEQMIADCKFDKADFFNPRDLPSEILTEKEVLKNGKLFKFKDYYSGTKAIKRMERAGYKPATLQELLALAKVKPNLQRKYWIAALENYSEFNKYRFEVPMLIGNNDKRNLVSDEWGDSFFRGNGIYCLGIKKS